MSAIIVEKDLCTRCGICSEVCPMGIIVPAKEEGAVPETSADACIRCGHCEVFCPAGAITVNDRPTEKEPLPAGAGEIPAETLALYLKSRRSVRCYAKEPVPKEKILQVLDVARYAASGGNGQQVQWLVIHDKENVHRLAGLTVDWMRTIKNSSHPMSGYVPGLIAAWDAGIDPICRGAPHLVVAHIPENNPVASVDAFIALTHFDIAAPAFGIGACWAGFLSMAARSSYGPLLEALALPAGREYSYSLFFGTPKYRTRGIPRRNPLKVTWG
jgi:nitroreductase/NAD-dependent dihydropyrimidine dehydrogenase PreA subunit